MSKQAELNKAITDLLNHSCVIDNEVEFDKLIWVADQLTALVVNDIISKLQAEIKG
jgi:hypothetical protein